MKKMNYVFLVLLSLMFCITNVNALGEKFDLNNENRGKLINVDLNSSTVRQAYITTYTYNRYGVLIDTTTIESSEEEAKMVANNKNLHIINGKLQDISKTPSLMGVIDGTYYQTDSKILSVNYRLNGTYNITYMVEWLTTPIVKSYDVSGFRWENSMSISDISSFYASQETNAGSQTYGLSGTNTKFFSNGLGTSMNLFDDATKFEIYIIIESNKSFGNRIWATYQHAVNNISLATSQNYSIGSSGLGGVLEFHNGYSKYFDDMNGLTTTLA